MLRAFGSIREIQSFCNTGGVVPVKRETSRNTPPLSEVLTSQQSKYRAPHKERKTELKFQNIYAFKINKQKCQVCLPNTDYLAVKQNINDVIAGDKLIGPLVSDRHVSGCTRVIKPSQATTLTLRIVYVPKLKTIIITIIQLTTLSKANKPNYP